MRKLAALAVATITALTLSACAPLPEDVPATPVDFDACMISQKTDLIDPIAELAIYGIKHAVVSFGVQYQDKEVSAGKFESEAKKLVKLGCDFIAVTGPDFSPLLDKVVTSNPSVNFVYFSTRTEPELLANDRENLAIYSIDEYQAGLVTGFLAAKVSQTHSLSISCNGNLSNTFLNGIYNGAAKFDETNRVSTSVSIANMQPADVLVIAGCEDSLAPLASTISELKAVAVGYGADFYTKDALGDVKSQIASTVVPQVANFAWTSIAAALEGDFIGGSIGSVVATYGNQGIALSPEHDVNLPGSLTDELTQMIATYEAGK